LTKQQRIDLLHVDRERLAPAFAAVPIPKVLDATDCMTLYLKRTMAHGSFPDRLVAGVELLKMPRYERTMGRGYAACLVASEEDARALRAGGCAYSVEVVPNGVDERLLRSDPGGETKSLVFVGNMFYAPNVDAIRWFARSIYPRVTEADPEARLYVVGNAPNRSVRRLGRRPGIEVTGAVPSVAPWLQRATVAVVPIRIGGGFPNKVAEAMAAGIPVVSTSAGYRGIPNISPGTHLLEGDDADTFVHETIRLLKDAGLRRRIAAAGRELIQAQGRWSTSVTRLEELYLSMRERHAVPYRAGH
jgi:glycosyltransferase involved in cell wall biosynthesis